MFMPMDSIDFFFMMSPNKTLKNTTKNKNTKTQNAKNKVMKCDELH
jgi:hypothetical protein